MAHNTDPDIHLVNVFTSENHEGGNLAPIVLNAQGLSDQDMRDIARRYSRESAFVLPAPTSSGPGSEGAGDVDFTLRFFVPEHEMEMCGHATVGTAWVMHHLRVVQDRREIRFMTKSGVVRTRCVVDREGQMQVFVSQPKGTVEQISDDGLVNEIFSVLQIERSQLASSWASQNACTSRIKTVIPLNDVGTLNTLRTDFSGVENLCEKLGSTGLYPYAIIPQSADDDGVVRVEARQFPKASGYPEDAATGIAAAALAYALERNGVLQVSEELVVHQGRAMGFLSQITVQLEEDGCWVGGTCGWQTPD